jgi:two-component system cell cycle response regulator DivK
MANREALLEGKRVLIVEDTPENLRLFRAILGLEKAVVIEAERAEIGIELAHSESPDLILMDMQMPEMDGLTATKLLRADPQTSEIPILVITASAMREDRQRAFDAGCSGYITKPVDPATLVSQIVSFIHN